MSTLSPSLLPVADVPWTWPDLWEAVCADPSVILGLLLSVLLPLILVWLAWRMGAVVVAHPGHAPLVCWPGAWCCVSPWLWRVILWALVRASACPGLPRPWRWWLLLLALTWALRLLLEVEEAPPV